MIFHQCTTWTYTLRVFLNVSSWTLIYSSNVSPLSFLPLPKNYSLLKKVLTSRLQLSQNPQEAKQAILLYKVQQVKWRAFSESLCREGWVLKSVHHPSVTGFVWHLYKMQIYQVLDVSSLFPVTVPSAVKGWQSLSTFFKVLTLHTQCQKCFLPLSPRLVVTILCCIVDILSLSEKHLKSVYFSSRRALFKIWCALYMIYFFFFFFLHRMLVFCLGINRGG